MVPTKAPIIFDLGGVLIDWNPRYLYRKVFGEAEMERFLAEVCNPDWNLRLDAGRPFHEAIREKQAAWPHYFEAIEWWQTRWVEMLHGPVAGTVELLRELLDRGHPVYALTNWSAETYPLACERFEFLGWFRELVVSGRVGLAKPDPAIYRLAAARFGVEPAGTIFIDDAPRNVETALGLGFDGILFTGAEALRRSLQERGLLR